MAQKKKQEKDKKVVQPAVAYSGSVRIDFLKGKQVYKTINKHNAGTSELFRYIANCIVGNYNSSLKPNYIHTFYCDDETIRTAEITKNPAPLWAEKNSTCALNVPASNFTVRADKSSESLYEIPYIAELTFMLPYSQIQGTTNVVALYNLNDFHGATPLAFIVLTDDEVITLDTNNTSNIAITWQIAVHNQILQED